jgi:hypothetical protein
VSDSFWAIETRKEDGQTKVKLATKPGPATIRKTDELNSVIEIVAVGDEFDVQSNQFLYLELELPEDDEPVITLKFGEIPNYPSPYEFSEVSVGYWRMDKFFYPLWKFVATDSPAPPDSTDLGENRSAIRYAGDYHLQMRNTFAQTSSGWVVVATVFRPDVRGEFEPN